MKMEEKLEKIKKMEEKNCTRLRKQRKIVQN